MAKRDGIFYFIFYNHNGKYEPANGVWRTQAGAVRYAKKLLRIGHKVTVHIIDYNEHTLKVCLVAEDGLAPNNIETKLLYA